MYRYMVESAEKWDFKGQVDNGLSSFIAKFLAYIFDDFSKIKKEEKPCSTCLLKPISTHGTLFPKSETQDFGGIRSISYSLFLVKNK